MTVNLLFFCLIFLRRQKQIKSWPCENKLHNSRYKIRALGERLKRKSRRLGSCGLAINRGGQGEDVSCCEESEVNRGNMRK